jgi:hypothetical protein
MWGCPGSRRTSRRPLPALGRVGHPVVHAAGDDTGELVVGHRLRPGFAAGQLRACGLAEGGRVVDVILGPAVEQFRLAAAGGAG